MTSSFLAFFGHVNIDVSIRVPVLPRVGSVNATKVSENFGGTAGNFAIVAQKLGLDFDLYSAVSEKTHAGYLKYLTSIGINIRHIDRQNESYGPVCYISSDGNEQVAYVYQGPMEAWAPASNYPIDAEYRWVHLSTGPPEEYMKLFDVTGKSRITFDPGQEVHYRYNRAASTAFIDKADMFTGNEAEFQKLKEITGYSDRDMIDRIGTIIVTKGQSGVSVFTSGDKMEFAVLPTSRVYDTIGAGDAFRSGLYLGLSKGMGIEDSILSGIVVSSCAIESPLTDFRLTFSDVENLIRENRDLMVK